MVLRQIISRALLSPNFERELSGSIAAQVATVPAMVDNFLAPQAFAYDSRGSAAGSVRTGAFQTTGHLRQSAAAAVKVHVPIQSEGMFADQLTWHK
jgi:hypothetical protein